MAVALPPLTPIDEIGSGSGTAAPRPQPTITAVAPPRPPKSSATTATAEKKSRESAGAGHEAAPIVGIAAPPAGPDAEGDRADRPKLQITALRLCSRVKGFGSFEPMDADTLTPGRRIRVYWEMAGLEYKARGDGFVSRLAAHLELRSEADGSVAWERSPLTAEDVCPHRRRDYYASVPIDLPATLKPGSYRLRLTQTDLIANRAASREIPITIVC